MDALEGDGRDLHATSADLQDSHLALRTVQDVGEGRAPRSSSSTRALFASTDMAEQREKFMKTITTIVAELEYPDILLPGIEALGRRHAGYGAKEEHYESVRPALLWTLRQSLGEESTPEAEEAWAETYGTLASTMKDAAAGA